LRRIAGWRRIAAVSIAARERSVHTTTEVSMEAIQFTKNFNDLCVESDVNAGFQFEFYCESCNDTWRTEFVPYRSGQLSGWLGKASGLLGAIGSQVGGAAEGVARSGFGNAKDEAFRAAVEKAKGHFHRCAKCRRYMCGQCWNTARGLCIECAPEAEVELEAAKAQGEAAGASEAARAEGEARGQKLDTKRDRQLVCPSCGAQTHGAKFCPECGGRLATKTACPKCSVEIAPGTRFCPECGQKL
jgi:hypothetical protein